MQVWSYDDVTRYSSKAVYTVFLLLYRVANQVLMRPDKYKAVFRKYTVFYMLYSSLLFAPVIPVQFTSFSWLILIKFGIPNNKLTFIYEL